PGTRASWFWLLLRILWRRLGRRRSTGGAHVDRNEVFVRPGFVDLIQVLDLANVVGREERPLAAGGIKLLPAVGVGHLQSARIELREKPAGVAADLREELALELLLPGFEPGGECV